MTGEEGEVRTFAGSDRNRWVLYYITPSTGTVQKQSKSGEPDGNPRQTQTVRSIR